MEDWRPGNDLPTIDMDVVLRLESGEEIDARWEAAEHVLGPNTDLTVQRGQWLTPEGDPTAARVVAWKRRISN